MDTKCHLEIYANELDLVDLCIFVFLLVDVIEMDKVSG